jgi:Tfp pilus assembly protein PilV
MEVTDNPGTLRSGVKWERGTTVVEAIVSVAIITIALGALMTLNGNQLRLVKASRETNSASLVVQERVEKLRTISWPDLVDPTHMSNSFLGVEAKAAPILNEISEKVLIIPFPTTGTSTPMELKKQSNSTVTVVTNGSGLVDEKLVRVDLTLGWKGSDGKPHTRAVSTLLAKSGVNRNDVPAMGPVSGGPFDAFTPLPKTDPGPVELGGSGSGSGNGNGNANGLGNGNGNINGKPGKG